MIQYGKKKSIDDSMFTGTTHNRKYKKTDNNLTRTTVQLDRLLYNLHGSRMRDSKHFILLGEWDYLLQHQILASSTHQIMLW